MYALGDTHGSNHYLKTWVLKDKRDCHIFHVGDYEKGYTGEKNENKKDEDFNAWLAERNIIMYVIRGNHDDPYYFQGNHVYSHLQFLPDYTVIEVEGSKVLCVGGAISPDRRHGKIESDIAEKLGQPRNWWEDEGFVLREDILNELTDIDTVITHTAPTFCAPFLDSNYPKFMRRLAEHDKTLLDDIRKEREDMDKMFKILQKRNNVRHHFYGHFHRFDITNNLYTQHIVLDKSELHGI